MCVYLCVHEVLCDTQAASRPPPHPLRTCLTGYNVTAPPTWHQNKLLSPCHLAGGPVALLRQPPELTPSASHANTHNPPPQPRRSPSLCQRRRLLRLHQNKKKSFGRHKHLFVPSPRVGRGRRTLAGPQETGRREESRQMTSFIDGSAAATSLY